MRRRGTNQFGIVRLAKVADLEIRGKSYPVKLGFNGEFLAEHIGEDLAAPTLEGLRKKLLDVTAEATASVSVPFAELHDDGSITTGCAISVHGGTGNVVVRWDESKRTEQLRFYNTGDYVKPLSKTDVAAWKQLCWNVSAAERARDAFKRNAQLSLVAVTKKAMADALRKAKSNGRRPS